RSLAACGPGPSAAHGAGHAPGTGAPARRGPAGDRQPARRRRQGGHPGGRGGPARARGTAGRSDTSFLEKCQKRMQRWRTHMAALEDGGRDPVAPQYVVGVLNELASDDAVLTCDSGTIATWVARYWTFAAAASSTCPATWPRWRPGCRTRSASSTHSPGGRSSPTSATAGSPC